ncbi:MAG: septum formation initiator family protein [Candidatus Babeliales bacterium]|nr:septum formation initiator family protein [Candidatus Babeliales bacterium]
MKVIKRRVLRIFFVLEVMVFAGFYVMGPHGLRAQQKIDKENAELKNETVVLQQELHTLNETIAQWDAHPFFKEKIAREQLQMARKDDQIYYMS